MPASVSSLRKERVVRRLFRPSDSSMTSSSWLALRGMTPVPLRAQLMDGHEARTDKRGWYLNAKHSLAIGENGEYYHLVVTGGFAERLRGVKLHPSLPPMHIGRGGRDGETGELKEFLTWLIDSR